MKLASVLLHIAIAASLAAALSLLTGHIALGAFSFTALAFLGAIAAADYTPRSRIATPTLACTPASRRVNPLRLAA
jgi:hypothetical protein